VQATALLKLFGMDLCSFCFSFFPSSNQLEFCMSVGKQVRMRRLMGPSGRMLAITIDHPITRGLMPGLEVIHGTMK